MRCLRTYLSTLHISNASLLVVRRKNQNSLKILKAIPAEAYYKCIEKRIQHSHACSREAYLDSDNTVIISKYGVII